jgi:hypothetical protein
MNWKKVFTDFPVWFMVSYILTYGLAFLFFSIIAFVSWSWEPLLIWFSWGVVRFFVALSFTFALIIVFTQKEYYV